MGKKQTKKLARSGELHKRIQIRRKHRNVQRRAAGVNDVRKKTAVQRRGTEETADDDDGISTQSNEHGQSTTQSAASSENVGLERTPFQHR